MALALLGFVLFYSFLALPPFLSLAMETLILFHRVLEGCNLLFDFLQGLAVKRPPLLRDFELRRSLHIAAAGLAPRSEEALSPAELHHPGFPDHTSHESNGGCLGGVIPTS